MNSRIRRLFFVALLLPGTAASAPAWSQNAQGMSTPMVLGLDHIPLAVTDLDGATERYRELGFTLKPGRLLVCL